MDYPGRYKRESGGSVSEKMTKAEVRERDLKMEGGATSQGMWLASGSLERQGSRFSPELPEGIQSYQHLDISTSDLQNFKILSLCCLEILTLW